MSYRRAGAQPSAALIAQRLRELTGTPDTVFIDDQLVPGTNFVDAIEARLDICDVLVAVIDSGWLRRERPTAGPDYVHIEIAAALRNKLDIIPVLVDRAVMPRRDDLHAEIRAFADLQPFHLFSDDQTRRLDDLAKKVDARLRTADERRSAAPDVKPAGGNQWQWQATLRGDGPTVYNTVADRMVRAHPRAHRRGRLMSERPTSIVLMRRHSYYLVELRIDLSAGHDPRRTLLRATADQPLKADLTRLATDVAATRRIESTWSFPASLPEPKPG